MNVAQARRNVERNIARNPLSVIIQRGVIEKPDGAGGTIIEPVMLPDQTVRIFMSAMGAQSTAKEGGQIQVQRWGLLAKWDADIQADDTFDVDSRQFRVRGISPVRTGGQVVSLQVDLEEVK